MPRDGGRWASCWTTSGGGISGGGRALPPVFGALLTPFRTLQRGARSVRSCMAGSGFSMRLSTHCSLRAPKAVCLCTASAAEIGPRRWCALLSCGFIAARLPRRSLGSNASDRSHSLARSTNWRSSSCSGQCRRNHPEAAWLRWNRSRQSSAATAARWLKFRCRPQPWKRCGRCAVAPQP